MANEDSISKIRHRIKFEGNLGLGWFAFIAIVFMIVYDDEIRCAMGNKTECVKMEPKPK